MNTVKIDFDNLGFYLREINDENGDTWILEGHCSRCGKCCAHPQFNVGYNDENGICKQLKYETIDGKINYKCLIYENRPVGCVLWPRELEDLKVVPDCTFKFSKKI